VRPSKTVASNQKGEIYGHIFKELAT